MHRPLAKEILFGQPHCIPVGVFDLIGPHETRRLAGSSPHFLDVAASLGRGAAGRQLYPFLTGRSFR
jgi:hypothetical protein